MTKARILQCDFFPYRETLRLGDGPSNPQYSLNHCMVKSRPNSWQKILAKNLLVSIGICTAYWLQQGFNVCITITFSDISVLLIVTDYPTDLTHLKSSRMTETFNHYLHLICILKPKTKTESGLCDWHSLTSFLSLTSLSLCSLLGCHTWIYREAAVHIHPASTESLLVYLWCLM